MIFKRKKNHNLSSTTIRGVIDEKMNSKVETLYVGAMCFAAACLSCMALEVGARSPLGHSVTKSATFNAIFRRSYNLKIKIMLTNVVTGLITTVMLALGDIYDLPYLYIPWLVNTLKGMIFCQGPALLGLSYIWLPDAGIPAGTFIFLTLLLFVEQSCLWFDVFTSYRRCWIDYTERNSKEIVEPEVNRRGNKCGDENVEHAVAKSKLCDATTASILHSTKAGLAVKSVSSDTVVRLRCTRSSSNSKPRGNGCKTSQLVA